MRLGAEIEIEVWKPALKSGDDLRKGGLEVVVDDDRVEVALSDAELDLSLGILQPHLDLLGCLSSAPSQTLLQFRQRGRIDEDVLRLQAGFLHVLHTLDVYVEETDLPLTAHLYSGGQHPDRHDGESGRETFSIAAKEVP
jgi:hypothetical protein